MSEIALPHNWIARPHQNKFMRAMLPAAQGGEGKKRACLVWHRRCGKDSASINFTAVAAHQKVATYWHLLPTAIQGRHVVWDAIDPRTGVKTIDQAWPQELRAGTNSTEMKITLKNGSMWQVVGSDNYDRLVGSNPFGVVFSEYSVSDPSAWNYIRPMLKENGGWAIFIYTSRGKNHGHDLYQMAKKNDLWFCELLDIEHTFRNDGTPVISQQDYQEEIDDGMDLLLARQEYYCSFDAGLFGSYYTEEMSKAKFGDYPYDPRKPVHTFWDIGLKDATSIWFGQESGDGSAINIVDYEEATNTSFVQWVARLREKQYVYGINSMPHDFRKRDWKDGASAARVARDLGFNYELTPNIAQADGIGAVRTFLPRLRFNTTNDRVSKGVDSLYNYRREYNEKLRIFMDRPVHDWASNGADAMRYMAIAWPENWRLNSGNRFKVVPAVRTASGVRRKAVPRSARGR